MSAEGVAGLRRPTLSCAALPACPSFCIIKSVNVEEEWEGEGEAGYLPCTVVEKPSLEMPSLVTVVSIPAPLIPPLSPSVCCNQRRLTCLSSFLILSGPLSSASLFRSNTWFCPGTDKVVNVNVLNV